MELYRSSKESSKAEVTAAEARGRAEAEKAGLERSLESAMAHAQAEQSSLQTTIQRLEADAKDYKVCCFGPLAFTAASQCELRFLHASVEHFTFVVSS